MCKTLCSIHNIVKNKKKKQPISSSLILFPTIAVQQRLGTEPKSESSSAAQPWTTILTNPGTGSWSRAHDMIA